MGTPETYNDWNLLHDVRYNVLFDSSLMALTKFYQGAKVLRPHGVSYFSIINKLSAKFLSLFSEDLLHGQGSIFQLFFQVISADFNCALTYFNSVAHDMGVNRWSIITKMGD